MTAAAGYFRSKGHSDLSSDGFFVAAVEWLLVERRTPHFHVISIAAFCAPTFV